MPSWNAETQEWEWAEAELDAEVEAGRARTAERRMQQPMLSIVDVRFLENERRVRIDLDNGTTFIFPVDRVQGLAGATAEQLSRPKLLGHDTVAWDDLDAIVPASDLMTGVFGSKAWMARLSQMGKKGGAARSEAKVAAARANGKRGGRPKRAMPG